MRTLDFLRKANYEGYNAFVKNWYGETDTHPISEQCLGDWMVEDFDNFWPVFMKLAKGHWYDIALEEATAAVDGVLNILYKNASECKFHEIKQDMIWTCLENTDQCIFFANSFKGNSTDIMPLVSKGFDLFELINTDDSCFSDKQLIEEYERLWSDFGSILRSTYGFEGHLDLTKKHPHHMSLRHFIGKVITIVFDEIKAEATEVIDELPKPDFSHPLGHWGENPMVPQIDFPIFEQPKHQEQAFGLFGRPDEMDFMHLPKFEFPDLHLF